MGYYISTHFSSEVLISPYVIGFIESCDKYIDVAMYSLTHDAIADALIAAHNRGVRVRILTDKVQASSSYADDERLEAAGILLVRDLKSGLMHHKFAIGDGEVVCFGSYNWTKSADIGNMENWNLCKLKYVVSRYQEEFERLWEMNLGAAE